MCVSLPFLIFSKSLGQNFHFFLNKVKASVLNLHLALKSNHSPAFDSDSESWNDSLYFSTATGLVQPRTSFCQMISKARCFRSSLHPFQLVLFTSIRYYSKTKCGNTDYSSQNEPPPCRPNHPTCFPWEDGQFTTRSQLHCQPSLKMQPKYLGRFSLKKQNYYTH